MSNNNNRTSISADNRVVANPEELQILLSKYAPQRGWYTALGYAKKSTGLNKTNANRRDGNEEFGRSLHHWFIDRYLDSDDYKRVGEPNVGKNGKPLKTVHKASNPFEADGVELVKFINFKVRWSAGDYEGDCNRRRLIVNKYMSKPCRLARMTGSQDSAENPHSGDAAAFAKKLLAYYSGNPDRAQQDAEMTPELASEVWNYVRPNAGGAPKSPDPSPRLSFYESHPDPNSWYDYYLVTPERGVEKVDNDFVKFWRQEFGGAPKTAPTSTLSSLLDRLVPGRFQSYLLSNVAYMVFTCKGTAESPAQRILYVNEELDLDGKPDASKRLMRMSNVDKGQLSEQ